MGIKVKNITYAYNEELAFKQVAIQDISFEIEDGEFVGIIGHTGSGKSTLLQTLNGLIKPNAGSIEIDGVDIVNGRKNLVNIRKQVGLVFQYPEYQLFEENVKKDVAYGPINLGYSQEEANKMAEKAISLVGLNYDEIAEKSPFELSGGQKRRVAIAGIVAMEPKILILDEPTAGLDPKNHDKVLKMLKKLHEEQGNITILVSHSMEDICETCDKVLVMNRGRIVMNGTPSEVFSKKRELESIGLGVPSINQLLWDLKEAGCDIDTGILNLKDGEEAIYKMLKKLGK